MKNFKFIVVVAIVIWIGSLTGLTMLLKESFKVKKILNIKKNELKDIIQANSEIGKLQKNIFNQKIEELKIEESIPKDEKSPVDLLMSLASISQRSGFQNIKFGYGKKSEDKENMFMGGLPPSGGGSNADSFSNNYGTSNSSGIVPSLIESKVLILDGEINFQLIYPFLEEILNLKRLVTIESIDINQSDKISPRLKVKITLVFYSFLK